MSSWDVQAFCLPAPGEVTPTALPAHLHLSTFISAFIAVLGYGMENGPPACISTVSELRHALETVEKPVRICLLFHALELVPYSQQVRELLVCAMNHGLEDAA